MKFKEKKAQTAKSGTNRKYSRSIFLYSYSKLNTYEKRTQIICLALRSCSHCNDVTWYYRRFYWWYFHESHVVELFLSGIQFPVAGDIPVFG